MPLKIPAIAERQNHYDISRTQWGHKLVFFVGLGDVHFTETSMSHE